MPFTPSLPRVVLIQTLVQHGSCPTCRNIFLNIRPPCDSDGESSDGDYFPNEEEEEEEEFIDDDIEDEFDVDETELILDWDDILEGGRLMEVDMNEGDEWGDEDTTFSEADMSISAEIVTLAEDDDA